MDEPGAGGDYDDSWPLLELLTMVLLFMHSYVRQRLGSFCTVLYIHSYVKHPSANCVSCYFQQ